MFTLFQQGFALGFFTGAVTVLTVLLTWDAIATAFTRLRRNRGLVDASRFKRSSYIALSAHNDTARIDKIFRVKR